MSVLTFEQFLHSTAEKGEVINTLFEERLFGLVGVLHRIAEALVEDGVPYELIGGLAVLVHVEEVSPEHATLTRDVDLMVRREDLETIKNAAARRGFRFRHVAGIDTLLYRDSGSAVRLFFSETPIAPEKKLLHDEEVMVIPVADPRANEAQFPALEGPGSHTGDGRRWTDYAGSRGEFTSRVAGKAEASTSHGLTCGSDAREKTA